jgi:hypothetical protein
MHKMVTRNRSRKTSIDIDNEELPVSVANDVLNADQTSPFLRAESKDDKDAESIHEINMDGDLDGDWDDYVNVVVDTDADDDAEEDEEEVEDETHICTDMIAMSSPYILEMVEKGRYCVQYMYGASSLYLFWIMLHYCSAQMYVYYCAPRGFYGFLISPFLVAAPHCRAIRWIIHNGGNMVDNMWLILGTWLCSKIITGA